MNHVINWIAINNVYMIRVGVSAILCLLLAYVFRVLFVPKIKVVGEDLEDVAEKTPTKNEQEANASNEVEAEAKKAEISAVNRKQDLEGNEKLRGEIRNLREQLSKAESKISELNKQKAEAQSQKLDSVENRNESQSGENSESPLLAKSLDSDLNNVDNRDVVAELNAKIQKLEARLFEYEIISEDISEISLLRQRNEELQKQIDAFGANDSASVEEKSEAPDVSTSILSDNLLDEVFANIEEKLDGSEGTTGAEDSSVESVEANEDQTESDTDSEIFAMVEEVNSLSESAKEATAQVEVISEPEPSELMVAEPEKTIDAVKIKVEKSLDVTSDDKELMSQFEEELMKKGEI